MFDSIAGNDDVVFGVSDFVAVLNQTMEFAYPAVVISGELANLRVSKNRWVYFDLKDESSSVKFFATVFQLPGPLEDGMIVNVRGVPRLHNLYGFSVTAQSIQPAGEGSIRRAADLLRAKLQAEGLFDDSRKRALPYPPTRIGLITSAQSAAYADFTKIIKARWQGVAITLIDVQVQGEPAPTQIVAAIEQMNALAEPPEVIVIVRGGGSAEDLAAFSTEQVTRAVAASRVPTLVAIGHEIDTSLAELAADRRASTPSNAAELLVPDRRHVVGVLHATATQLEQAGARHIAIARQALDRQVLDLEQAVQRVLDRTRSEQQAAVRLLAAYDPTAILRRGYAIVRHDGQALRQAESLQAGDIVDIELAGGAFSAAVQKEQ
jgi:exodeoxyribonuclease VII large subunit